MKQTAKKLVLLILIITLLFLVGCAGNSADRFFALPKPESQYLLLQDLIDEELQNGYEYAAPSSGANRQSVQLVDLNQDGTEEALVFLSHPTNGVKINLYTRSGNKYTLSSTITGEGISVGSTGYADLNQDGIQDLIIIYKMPAGSGVLLAYNLSIAPAEQLLRTEAERFATYDLTGSGQMELLTLRKASTDTYYADMYTFNGTDFNATTAALSNGISSFRRIYCTALGDQSSALVVESLLKGGSASTDIFVNRSGSIYNLTLNRSTGVSELTSLYTSVSPQDIDGDGIIEIPSPRQLYSSSSDVYWSIAWYRYDSTGRATIVCNTYHCVEDGWYFLLPSGWESGLVVSRSVPRSGEAAVTFSSLGADGSLTELLTIYTLTGENREQQAKAGSRFILLEQDSTIYAADSSQSGLTQNTIKENFQLIHTEWILSSF